MSPVLSICPTRGCGALTSGGACAQHAAAAAAVDNARRHAKQRAHGRDARAWRTLRRQRLELAGELCELRVDDRCAITATTVHLDPALRGRHDIATIADLRAACEHCHGVVDGRRSLTGGGYCALAARPPRAQAPARNVHHERSQPGQPA